MSKTDIPKGVINKSTVIRHDGKVASAQWSDLKAARHSYLKRCTVVMFDAIAANVASLLLTRQPFFGSTF